MAKHFIGGKWVAGSSGSTLPAINPSTGEAYDTIADGTERDIDAAVQAARAGFDGAWGKLTPLERGRIMLRYAQVIADHAQELAKVEAQDTGKPWSVALADTGAASRYFEFYGAAAD